MELDSHSQVDYPEPKRDLNRAVELDSHRQLDYPEPRNNLTREAELGSDRELSFRLCLCDSVSHSC